MESTSDKTSPRPGADRPSLLDSAENRSAGSGPETRMLAWLEHDDDIHLPVSGRSRRFGGTKRAAILLLVLLGSAGTFFALRTSDDTASSRIGTASAAPPIVTPRAERSADAGTPASEVIGTITRAIVGTSVTPIEPMSSVASAASPPAAPSNLGSTPFDKLALDNTDPPAMQMRSTAASSPAESQVEYTKKSPSKIHARVTRATRAGGAKPSASAPAKARGGNNDADTELVAAIIARLDRRGAQPVNAESPTHREGR